MGCSGRGGDADAERTSRSLEGGNNTFEVVTFELSPVVLSNWVASSYWFYVPTCCFCSTKHTGAHNGSRNGSSTPLTKLDYSGLDNTHTHTQRDLRLC